MRKRKLFTFQHVVLEKMTAECQIYTFRMYSQFYFTLGRLDLEIENIFISKRTKFEMVTKLLWCCKLYANM